MEEGSKKGDPLSTEALFNHGKEIFGYYVFAKQNIKQAYQRMDYVEN